MNRHTAPGGCLHLPSPLNSSGWTAHYLAEKGCPVKREASDDFVPAGLVEMVWI